MNNSHKSPSKNNSKSVTSMPRSHHKLIHSPKTASKVRSEIKKQIFHSQAYKTILSKLLSKNNIEQFLYQVFKFGTISDEFSIPYIKKQFLAQSPKNDFPELGKSFLRDGSFLKHYCNLLILKQSHQSQAIKKIFYNKYKEEVVEKKAYFQRFFKAQIKLQNDHILQTKLQTSRKNITYSLKKTALSLKKAVTEKIQMSQKIEKRLESISAIDPIQFKQNRIVPQNDYSHNGVNIKELSQRNFKKSINQKEAKTPDKNKDVFDCQELSYVSCRSKKKKYQNQSEQQRQKRLLGIISNKQKMSEKKQTNIIKFQDSIYSNKRLKEIYQSIKKEKQINISQQKINSNIKNQLVLSPVFRSNYRHLKTQFQTKTLKQLTAQLIEKISCSERSLLKYFPNITKIGFKNRIQKDSPIILGHYREKILMKSFVIDYNNCMQPTLIAVYLQPQNTIESKHLCYFSKEIDKDIDVLLVDQFASQSK